MGGADRPLSRVTLAPRVADGARRAGLSTCRDVLRLGELALVERCDLFLDEARSLLDAAAARASPAPRTALQLLEARAAHELRALATGCAALDAHLGGGLRSGSLTEAVGPAGMGKTQLCLAVAARALVDGAGRVLYVDAERSYQPRRLLALIGDALAARGRQAERPEELAARVAVHQPTGWAEYAECLGELEGELLERPAALLVVDSVAAPVRAHFGKTEFAERASALAEQATLFKRLAEAHGVAVLVTNQVMQTGADAKAAGSIGLVHGKDDHLLSACLGNTWAHGVNTRLILQCAPTDALGPGGRQLRVAKDASCADAVFEWAIPP